MPNGEAERLVSANSTSDDLSRANCEPCHHRRKHEERHENAVNIDNSTADYASSLDQLSPDGRPK